MASREQLARQGSGSRGHCETTQLSTGSQTQGMTLRLTLEGLLSRPQAAALGPADHLSGLSGSDTYAHSRNRSVHKRAG